MSCSDINTISIRRGDHFDLAIVYKANGVAVNLTGYQAEFAVSWILRAGVQRQSVTVSTSGGGIDALTTDGRVVVHLTEAQTLTIKPGTAPAAFQLRLTNPSGFVTTIYAGIAEILADNFEV